MRFVGELAWATQAQMAELFGIDRDTVDVHLRNVFDEGELDREATTEELSVVRREGSRDVNRGIVHYGLTPNDEAELDDATHKDFLSVRREGSREVPRSILHYNVDAVISVRYLVHLPGGVHVRRWAAGILRDQPAFWRTCDGRLLSRGSNRPGCLGRRRNQVELSTTVSSQFR